MDRTQMHEFTATVGELVAGKPNTSKVQIPVEQYGMPLGQRKPTVGKQGWKPAAVDNDKFANWVQKMGIQLLGAEKIGDNSSVHGRYRFMYQIVGSTVGHHLDLYCYNRTDPVQLAAAFWDAIREIYRWSSRREAFQLLWKR